MNTYKQLETRIQLIQENKPELKEAICSAKTVFDIVKPMVDLWDREKALVIYVDRNNNILGINQVSTGSLSGSAVYPREVFKAAILGQASGIVLVHNHPSGDPEPSATDDKLTREIILGGQALGIQVLDHLIIGDTYYSYGDKGRISAFYDLVKTAVANF